MRHTGMQQLKLTKLDFTKHPLSKQIVKSSVLDYQPAHFVPAEPYAPPVPEPEPAKKQARRKNLYSSAIPPSEF